MSTPPRHRRRAARDVAGELGVCVGMEVAGPLSGVPADGPLVVEALEWQGQRVVAIVAELEADASGRVRCWFVPVEMLRKR